MGEQCERRQDHVQMGGVYCVLRRTWESADMA